MEELEALQAGLQDDCRVRQVIYDLRDGRFVGVIREDDGRLLVVEPSESGEEPPQDLTVLATTRTEEVRRGYREIATIMLDSVVGASHGKAFPARLGSGRSPFIGVVPGLEKSSCVKWYENRQKDEEDQQGRNRIAFADVPGTEIRDPVFPNKDEVKRLAKYADATVPRKADPKIGAIENVLLYYSPTANNGYVAFADLALGQEVVEKEADEDEEATAVTTDLSVLKTGEGDTTSIIVDGRRVVVVTGGTVRDAYKDDRGFMIVEIK